MQDVDERLRKELERENNEGANDERWARFYGRRGGDLVDEQEEEKDGEDECEGEGEDEDGDEEEETSDMDIESDSD